MIPVLSRLRNPVEVSNSLMEQHVPVPFDREGNLLFLRFERFNSHVRRLSDAIPTSVWQAWVSAANDLFRVFIGVVLGIVAVFLFAFAELVISLLLAVEIPDTTPDPQLPAFSIGALISGLAATVDVAIQLGLLLLWLIPTFVVMWATYHAIILLFLPGLVAHELGHAITVLKHGGDIDSTGLVFAGPFVAGAFVEPNDASIKDFTITQIQEVFAAGVIHNVALAVVLYAASLWVASPVVGNVLVVLATFEALNAIFNAAPLSKLDGGQYVSQSLSSWLGIRDAKF